MYTATAKTHKTAPPSNVTHMSSYGVRAGSKSWVSVINSSPVVVTRKKYIKED